MRRLKIKEMDDAIKKLQSDHLKMKDEVDKLLSPPKFNIMDKVKYKDLEGVVIGLKWDYQAHNIEGTNIPLYTKGWYYSVYFNELSTLEVKEDEVKKLD